MEGDTVDVVDYIGGVLDTGNLLVRTSLNRFGTKKKSPNAEPDFRSGLCLASNLDLDHGSEPDLSITTWLSPPSWIHVGSFNREKVPSCLEATVEDMLEGAGIKAHHGDKAMVTMTFQKALPGGVGSWVG